MGRNTVKNAILRTAAALAYDMVVGMFGVEAVACIRMLGAMNND